MIESSFDEQVEKYENFKLDIQDAFLSLKQYSSAVQGIFLFF